MPTTPPSPPRSPLRRRALWGVGVLGGLAGLAASLYGHGGRSPTSRPRVEAMEAFWALELHHGRDRSRVALRDFRDRGLVLNFWATWCAPCVREMPALAQLAQRPDVAAHWRVLGMAVDEALPVKAFVDKTQISFPTVVAGLEGLQWSRAFGNTQGGLPFTVLIKGDQVLERLTGESTLERLQAAIAKASA